MKKAIALAMAAMMLFALLAGCGGGDASAPAPADTTAQADTSAPVAAASSDGGEHSDWIPLSLTYTSHLPDGHPSEEQIRLFLEKADERMDGLIDIQIYSGGSMALQSDCYDTVASGVCDMGFLNNAFCAGQLMLTLLCDQPGFWYESGSAAAMAMNDYLRWVEENSDEMKDIIVLTTLGLGPQAIQTNRKIEKYEDLAGLSAYGPASYADAFLAWGITPNLVDYSEMYEGLRNGLLTASFNTIGAAGNALLQEVTDYCYYCNVVANGNSIIMNRATYEQMPESQRAVFRELWQEVQEEFVNLMLEDFTYGDDKMSQKYTAEVKYLEKLPDDVQQQMLAALEGMPEAYAEQCNELGLPGTEALACYREMLDKYNAEFPNDFEGSYMGWRQ